MLSAPALYLTPSSSSMAMMRERSFSSLMGVPISGTMLGAALNVAMSTTASTATPSTANRMIFWVALHLPQSVL